MKRETVMRMLKKRLAESKRVISMSHDYEDLVNILGGDNSREPQIRKNMQNDIKQLEFLIEKLHAQDNLPG